MSIVAVVPILGWLNRKHRELRAGRGLVWFFVIVGPGPSLAPR